MRCPEGEEGVHEDCCLHDYVDADGLDHQVCCWCGDLYLARWDEIEPHGEYRPRSRQGKRKSTAKSPTPDCEGCRLGYSINRFGIHMSPRGDSFGLCARHGVGES